MTGPPRAPADPGAEGAYTAYSYLAAGEDFRRFEPVAYVDGMENPTENFTNICGWLVRHGFDDDAIRGRHRGKRLPGPAGRLDQPLTGSGMGCAGADHPRTVR